MLAKRNTDAHFTERAGNAENIRWDFMSALLIRFRDNRKMLRSPSHAFSAASHVLNRASKSTKGILGDSRNAIDSMPFEQRT
jgi:hypothetical protein